MSEIENQFTKVFKELSKQIHDSSIDKGWWEEDRNNGELIALIHSELSEALEALRKDAMSDKLPDRLGVEEELADVIIRIMDMTDARGWNVAEAILEKIEYNKTRSYRHGNKNF